MTKRSLRQPPADQGGGISIYVSMVIMAILMLITLSFATIMVRNARQTHQGQSSVQAFYAAETGIGDARARLLSLFDAYGRGVKGVIPAKLKPIEPADLGDLNTILNDPLLVPGIPGKAVAVRDADSFVTTTIGGEVYFLRKTPFTPPATPTWASTQVLPPSVFTPTSEYGKALSVEGDCLFVGDPGALTGNRVYAFQYNNSTNIYDYRTFVMTSNTGDELGYALAVAEGANVLAVGAPGANSSEGALYLYTYDVNCNFPASPSVVLGPTAVSLPPDRMGAAVAAKGSRVAVALPGHGLYGQVYVFHNVAVSGLGGQATVVGASGAPVEESLALSVYHLAIGSPSQGLVRIFDYKTSNRQWKFQQELVGNGSTSFGRALVLEGTYLAIGEPDGYTAHLYQSIGGNWRNDPDPTKLQSVSGSAGSEFGYSLSLKNKHLAIGAPGSLPGVHHYAIQDLFDLTPEELSDHLGINRCVNKEDPDPDHEFKFDVGDSDAGIYYSCLSIELAPDILYYDEMERDRSTALTLKSIDHTTTDYAALEGLVIRWANSDESAGTNFNTDSYWPQFPDYASWNNNNYKASVLEVQVTPLNRTTGYDRQYLKDHSKILYFYPRNNGSPRNYERTWDSLNSGDIIEARCGEYEDDAGNTIPEAVCTVRLGNLISSTLSGPNPTVGDKFAFHIRIRSLYKPADIRIQGYNYSYTTPAPPSNRMQSPPLKDLADRRVRFRDIQAIIGATGHSNDVQVRLEERFRLQPAYAYPEAGVQSAQSVCKILISDQDTGTNITGGRLAPVGLTPPSADVQEDCRAW